MTVDLEELVASKARTANLPFARIAITEHQETFTEFGTIGFSLTMDFEGDVLVVTPFNLDALPPRIVELYVESNIAMLTDPERLHHGTEVFAPGPEWVQAHALEYWQAYHQFHAGQRMITVFGQARYDELQAYGLSEHLEQLDRFVIAPFPDQQYLAVATICKEWVKSTLMKEPPTCFPAIVQHLAAPIRPVYELVDQVPHPWLERSKLLYLLTAELLVNTWPIESYLGGQLVLRAPWQPVMPTLQRAGHLGNGLDLEAELVEATIKTAYQSLPHQQYRKPLDDEGPHGN